jgi:hypothetical protein
VSVQIGNLLSADHQTFSPGQLQIQRGDNALLVNANAVGDNQTGAHKSSFSNAVVVDDNGDGAQTYRFSTGYWYGDPGVVVNAYQAGPNFIYVSGDYHAAYSTPDDPGGGGSTTELTRQVVYLRPDFVVVYDRATTVKDDYPKLLQWHFLDDPTVVGNAFVETQGQSKLFGQTFSSVPLTTTLATVTVGNADVSELVTQNALPTASVRYVTALQIAPSTTPAMVSTLPVVSTDARLEGVQMGGQVVLFGRNGDVDLTTPVTYLVTATGSVQHLLTNLQAGKTYQVTVNGIPAATLAASAQGTITFSTSGVGVQTIQVSLLP